MRGTRVKRRISGKPGPKPSVFAIFSKCDFQGPVKGGLGGSPNDIFDVMQGSIYAYILCMALACRMYYDIYITTKTGRLSEEIRHAVSAKLKRWPRRILLSFAPSAAAGWHCEHPADIRRWVYDTALGLGIAVVLFTKTNCMLTG